MRIALVQMNATIGDFEGNTSKIIDFIHQARSRKCDLVVFPELAITGYPPQDLLLKTAFVNEAQHALQQIVPHTTGLAAVIGFVEFNPGEGRPLFNSAAFIADGKIMARIHKILLPTYDVFDEDRYFEPGQPGQVITYKGIRLGISICEDAWNDKDYWQRRRYRQDPIACLNEAGVDLMINIAASPYHRGKIALRSDMIRALAVKYRKPFIMVNTVGANDELIFDGSSRVFDARGRTLYAAPSFEEALDIIDFNDEPEPITRLDAETIENLYRALLLGIRDYVRKCDFKDVIIGISGGIDSAVTATLACDALGPEHVTGVFMPSRYTSRESYEDARQLASNLGIHWYEVSIDEIFEAYLGPLRKVYGQPQGVTEENVQARIRGNILMALSNQWGALVLSTGNKSELALGYCTLYGDMTGGLAVLGDVPKTMVYELAHFINQSQERIPHRILVKPPSAELRPNQRDEDDIPPYALIDKVIHLYIEEEKSLPEIIESGIDPELARMILTRIDRNEYKRRQAPPTLKVTSRAFGSGRRVPIAQRFRHQIPAEEDSFHPDV